MAFYIIVEGKSVDSVIGPLKPINPNDGMEHSSIKIKANDIANRLNSMCDTNHCRVVERAK